MAILEKMEDLLLSAGTGHYPPVQKWNPPLSGSIDIVVKANGDWYHEGVKFTRQALVKLFSSIIKKEGEDYFLVTPVEKWKIKVEDSPLLVIDMEITGNTLDAKQQIIRFKTSVDDIFPVDQHHLLRVKNNNEEPRPYVLVRDNLEALVHRNVFYQLAEKAVLHDGQHGIWSGGVFFTLG